MGLLTPESYKVKKCASRRTLAPEAGPYAASVHFFRKSLNSFRSFFLLSERLFITQPSQSLAGIYPGTNQFLCPWESIRQRCTVAKPEGSSPIHPFFAVSLPCVLRPLQHPGNPPSFQSSASLHTHQNSTCR